MGVLALESAGRLRKMDGEKERFVLRGEYRVEVGERKPVSSGAALECSVWVAEWDGGWRVMRGLGAVFVISEAANDSI